MNVIVVGAGIAGLSCATVLKAAGHQVTIFDKSRGPSGRMSTRRTEEWQCDHGAQYFIARDPIFQAEVKRWELAGKAAPWSAKFAVLDDSGKHIQDGELVRYVGIPRMTSPAKWISESLDLRLGSTISSILPNNSGWQVRTLEHGLINDNFDSIVIAIPAPQAIPLLRDIKHPYHEFVQKVKMVGSWTLMLQYSDTLDIEFDAAFVNYGPLRWVARDSSKPDRKGKETWVIQASAEWSENHIECTVDEVIPELTEAFIALGGAQPDSCIAHRWRYADSLPAMNDRFLWDKNQKLGICGDWINGGKVEGAWLSGFLLAQSII